MKKFCLIAVWLIFLFSAWSLSVVHLAVVLPPALVIATTAPSDQWLTKSSHGLNHLVLEGNPFSRGHFAGQKTKELLYTEESQLFSLFESIMPNALIRHGFLLGVMRWFWGIDKQIEEEHKQEMYGVSFSASSEFDRYADKFSRQIGYHGLHEVGQFFTDFASEAAGCTVFLIPSVSGWTVARNFDFEGGRVFDEEKILKWVFPEVGLPFVAVTWAGMVGIVTGVNQSGVYLSLNAAGSTDFRRFGTPSTLVALSTLQYSTTAREAVQRIERSTMFITDIFVVADRSEAYRVEKSPTRVRVEKLTLPSVVTNHLEDPLWKDDRINRFRRDSLTSSARFNRGKELLAEWKKEVPTELQLASFLRDKKGVGGKTLALGNRSAIDALIATHAVIYQSAQSRLYVSQGPSLVGAFLGFDLAASFQLRRPVRVASLPADSHLSQLEYEAVKFSRRKKQP